MLTAAERFAHWIEKDPPGTAGNHVHTWYDPYSERPGARGTYAGKYGRTISFFLNLYLVTGKPAYLDTARKTADTAIEKLWHKGLFRGHSAKPYYEAIDGVGYLLYAVFPAFSNRQSGLTARNRTHVSFLGIACSRRGRR